MILAKSIEQVDLNPEPGPNPGFPKFPKFPNPNSNATRSSNEEKNWTT